MYLNKLIELQKKGIRIIAPRFTTFQELGVLDLQKLNLYLIVRLIYRVYIGDIIHVLRHMRSINRSGLRLLDRQVIIISQIIVKILVRQAFDIEEPSSEMMCWKAVLAWISLKCLIS